MLALALENGRDGGGRRRVSPVVHSGRMTASLHTFTADSAAAPLPHEKLDAFRVAIELVELVAALPLIRGSSDARDQLKRAATSAALNCAEACGKHGDDRTRFFEIARGSSLESAAALRVLLALGAISSEEHERGRLLCGRLYSMFTKLSRK